MTRPNDPRDETRSEALLQELFDDTAAPLSDHAARRLEAIARGIPSEAGRRRSPLFGWLGAATAVAAAVVLALIVWTDGGQPPAGPGEQAVALSQDVHEDLAADAPTPVTSLSDEQAEGWEHGYGPFADDEAPSLVGSVSLAHGLEDPAELELWVQAADEILAETDEI